MTAFWGNLGGTLKNLFSIGKTDKISIENASGEVKVNLGSVERLRIESNGTLNVANTADYETLVTADDDIPNKKYVDDFTSYADSPLVATGGVIEVGTNAGTFKHSSLVALLRTTDSVTGAMVIVTKDAEDNIAITAADTTYFVVLNYNGGTPNITLSTTAPYSAVGDYRSIPLGRVRKDGSNNVHYVNGGFRFQDGVKKLHNRIISLRANELTEGHALAYSGTNNFTMEEGAIYAGVNRLTQIAYDSAVTTFIPLYGDGGVGWTEGTPRNTIDFEHYDDGSGVLGEIGVAKYGNYWVYQHMDDQDVYVVYGLDSYSLAGAGSESAPPVPLHLSDFGCLIGRITAPQAGGSFTDVQMVTDTVFTGTGVSDHGNLSGLGDDDHTGYVLADGSRDITVANEDNETFTINQNDTTNNPTAFEISNTGTGDCVVVNTDKLTIDPNGNTHIKTADGPYFRVENDTAEDADAGREGHLEFKGTQSGSEVTTLAKITGQHDGAADDQKGALVFKVNDGADDDAPTERLKIESDGTLNVAATTDYETLVTHDDDIPNRKFVMDNSGGSVTWETKDDNFSAVSGYGYRVDTDTNTKIITATLPGSPSVNDKISFLDLKQNFGTYALTLGRNSLKIMGLAEDFTAGIDNFNFTIIYTGATDGWVFI